MNNHYESIDLLQFSNDAKKNVFFCIESWIHRGIPDFVTKNYVPYDNLLWTIFNTFFFYWLVKQDWRYKNIRCASPNIIFTSFYLNFQTYSYIITYTASFIYPYSCICAWLNDWTTTVTRSDTKFQTKHKKKVRCWNAPVSWLEARSSTTQWINYPLPTVTPSHPKAYLSR